MNEYMEQVDEKWRADFAKLVDVVESNLPDGFERIMQYDMISYVVPLSTYPNGYHVTPNTPLPFISLAAQKRHLALYHMGIYGDEKLLTWFQEEYDKSCTDKVEYGEKLYSFYQRKKYSV